MGRKITVISLSAAYLIFGICFSIGTLAGKTDYLVFDFLHWLDYDLSMFDIVIFLHLLMCAAGVTFTVLFWKAFPGKAKVKYLFAGCMIIVSASWLAVFYQFINS